MACYLDRRKVTVPLHLQSLIPENAYVPMQELRNSVINAVNGLKVMEMLRNRRHEAMCPTYLVERHTKHIESVHRLFDNENPLNTRQYPGSSFSSSSSPASASAPKMSREFFQFHVDQRAYDQYACYYALQLESYIAGPYMAWMNAKQVFEWHMDNARLTEEDSFEWQWWWKKVFLVEMAKWESRMPDLAIPSWEEVVDELYQTFMERVDVDASNLSWFDISSKDEVVEA